MDDAVGGQSGPNQAAKLGQGRPPGEMEEVARAAAVRGAEARCGDGRAGQLGGQAGPIMLAGGGLDRVPDFNWRAERPQVVDMPVAGLGRIGRQVPPQPGGQPTRAIGAAQVEVVTGRKVELAQAADGDSGRLLKLQYQPIGAALGQLRLVWSNRKPVVLILMAFAYHGGVSVESPQPTVPGPPGS
jgi:hypothetical protein